MGVQVLRIGDDLRQARDAETAHLEAILKDHGPKALRLARLHDILLQRGVSYEGFELQASQGLEPRLWLDLKSCVTLLPDGRTYKLARYGRDRIETILETESLDDMVAAVAQQVSHARIVASREPAADSPAAAPSTTTLIYVWMTGLLTGIAAFALCAILLKSRYF